MKKSLKYFGILICITLLTACVGLGGLKKSQIKVLQQEGFVYTDDGWMLNLPSRLLFSTGEYTLQPDQEKVIADLSKKLHKIHLENLIIQGHTDNVGSEESNQSLSEKRAKSVTDIAINNGFLAENIKIIGFGSSKPIKSNDTEEGRSENRRVSIIIVP